LLFLVGSTRPSCRNRTLAAHRRPIPAADGIDEWSRVAAGR